MSYGLFTVRRNNTHKSKLDVRAARQQSYMAIKRSERTNRLIGGNISAPFPEQNRLHNGIRRFLTENRWLFLSEASCLCFR